MMCPSTRPLDSPSVFEYSSMIGSSSGSINTAFSRAGRADSRRPLGRGDDLLGRVGEPVGRDDLAAALLDELLAQLDVRPFEPDDQRDAEIELVVGRQQGRRRSCRTS